MGSVVCLHAALVPGCGMGHSVSTCNTQSSVILVELGREKEITITLGEKETCADDCSTIPANSITRAVLRIGDIILDTNVPGDGLSFNSGKTALVCMLGLVDGFEPYTVYPAHITVYDDLAYTGGIPWSRLIIKTVPWPGPETDE